MINQDWNRNFGGLMSVVILSLGFTSVGWTQSRCDKYFSSTPEQVKRAHVQTQTEIRRQDNQLFSLLNETYHYKEVPDRRVSRQIDELQQVLARTPELITERHPEDGSTVLMFAAREASQETYYFILRQPSTDYSAVNDRRQNVAHVLAEKGLGFELQATLPYLSTADLNRQDINGQTPLMLAISRHLHRESDILWFVTHLLSRPGIDLYVKDRYGKSAVDYAFELDRNINSDFSRARAIGFAFDGFQAKSPSGSERSSIYALIKKYASKTGQRPPFLDRLIQRAF